MPVNRIHGGPDYRGRARLDFSTTANACVPCPIVLHALGRSDPGQFPDPEYRDLRARLADLHEVEAERVLLAASDSEFIFRATAISGSGTVSMPRHAFVDYAAAAHAYARTIEHETHADASLTWFADPGSPLGQDGRPPANWSPGRTLAIIDRACAAMRLDASAGQMRPSVPGCFELWSPNRALGLTGVRAAYAIAPDTAAGRQWAALLDAACPSWPVGTQGVALMAAWAQPAVQAWLADNRLMLESWKERQANGLIAQGFRVEPSVTNFFVVHPPPGVSFDRIESLLQREGIAWRSTASFGLPNAWRIAVLAPAGQDHLFSCLSRVTGVHTRFGYDTLSS